MSKNNGVLAECVPLSVLRNAQYTLIQRYNKKIKNKNSPGFEMIVQPFKHCSKGKSLLQLRTDNRIHSAGSVTVEAALVFPIFFFTVYLIWQLFFMVYTEMRVAKDFESLSRSFSATGYAERAFLKDDLKDISWLYEAGFDTCLSKRGFLRNRKINCSTEEDGTIFVTFDYDICLRTAVLPSFAVPVKQSFSFYPAVGIYDDDKLREKEDDKEPEEECVYMTEHGTVYHLKKNCPYIAINPVPVDISEIDEKRNKSGRKYTVCSYCKKEDKTDTVYITDYGTKYHYSLKCPSLFRNVKEVPRSQVGNIHPCSKCGGKDD